GGPPRGRRSAGCVRADTGAGLLRGTRTAVCADAPRLPFADGAADCVMCVGAVVNYCSLPDIVAEISRIAAPGAMLVTHIELSNSFEFFLTPHYRQDAAFIKTFYKCEENTSGYFHRYSR